MQEKAVSAVISAIVAGLVSGVMVFVLSPSAPKMETSLDNLEVKSLKVTDQLTFRSPEAEQDQLLIKNGSIVATNKIIATQITGTQIAGHMMIGNRLMATTSDLSTPAQTWEFFTEIGADSKKGGEVVIRSPKGVNRVGTGVAGGNLVHLGFDANDGFDLYARNNPSTENPAGGQGFFVLHVPGNPSAVPPSTGSETESAYTRNADPEKTANNTEEPGARN